MRLEDLKRGMRCTTRDDVFIVDRVIIDNAYENSISYLKLSKNNNIGVTNMNGDLTGRDSNNDILIVEDITMNGYKTIWEKKEEKFYLKLPRVYSDSLVLNYGRLSERFYFDSRDEGSHHKTQFTQEEIDNLPHQDFIQSLEKELVE